MANCAQHDDTFLNNASRFSPALPHADEQPKRDDAITPDIVSEPESDMAVPCDCRVQSPADTEPGRIHNPTTTPNVNTPLGTTINPDNTGNNGWEKHTKILILSEGIPLLDNTVARLFEAYSQKGNNQCMNKVGLKTERSGASEPPRPKLNPSDFRHCT